ncbi:hypothetical protein [Mesorhizobium ventifaucium]|uniref:Transposase n=1 Tax=Mesorhizobium ventifaucium TaxID=666020 RepID=A0ABN8JMD0_9HYPH|nr:hypothetical protein [Mesorhizobium ventifaucium]CAH2399154.1 conserved hypothetical protein [Mesorhizobium ventifaucium]
MSYRDWHAGMKVVCVDNRGCQILLQVGAIYTVRALDAEWVYLAELSTISECPDSSGYLPRRFRPAQPRKADISIFTAMLIDQKVPA